MGRKRKRNTGSGDGISRRTVLLGLTGGTVGATGLLYTGAFSSATGNRPFGVSTAGDDRAFFQIEAKTPSGTADETVSLFDVTNGFGTEISDAHIPRASTDNVSLDGLTLEPTPLAPGAPGTISGTLSCEGSPGETVRDDVDVAITVESESESVDLTRSVAVKCQVPPQGVCKPRHFPPRCDNPLERFPERNEDTECNVDVYVETESVDQKIRNVDIGGALRVQPSEDIDELDIDELDIGGNASIGGFVRAEGTNIVKFKINSNIPDVVQVDASGNIGELIINSSTDGICATAGGSITKLKIDSVIGDDIRIDSGGAIDELEIDDTVEGNVTIDSGGAIDELELGGTVKGNVTIDSGGDIGELKLGGTVEGNVDIDGRGEISIELKGNSEISGDLTIISDGGDVTLDIKGNSSISGDLKIEIDSEGDIEFDDCDAVDGEVSPSELCGED